MKNDIMDKKVCDINYVKYHVDDWLRKMVVQAHVRYVKVIKSTDGTTITLEAISH